MTDNPKQRHISESREKPKLKMMKKVLAIVLLFSMFSCIEDEPNVESPAVSRDKAIAEAISTKDPNRIYVVTRILMGKEHNPSAPLLAETVVVNKANGKKSLVYISLNEERISAAGLVAPSCGSITGGWELRNDGCWYHGKLITACDGQTMFIADANPYTDNYIGNEPRCMSQDEFDTVV